MKKSPLVTILINNYNYADFLDKAIASALSQDYTNKEVVVIDDGSQDDSHKIIRKYGDNVRSVLKENGGQASTFNTGLEVCRGEIVCFLDADDTFTAEKVSRIVELFHQFSNIFYFVFKGCIPDWDIYPGSFVHYRLLI